MNNSQQKNNHNRNIGERIRSFRESKGLNQSQFADIIGVKQGFISKVETNVASFTIEHIILLRNIFHIDSNWLLFGEGFEPGATNLVIEKVSQHLEKMPEDAQRDVLKYAAEKELLSEYRAEMKARKTG